MSNWPKNAYIVMGTLIFVSIACVFTTYTVTRDSYIIVGFNDGQIYQTGYMFERMKKHLPMLKCDDIDSKIPRVELLSYKAKAIYIINTDNYSSQFCEY